MVSNKSKKMISWARPHIGRDEEWFVRDALRSTWISDGPYVWRFESTFAKLLGTRYCLTTSNGTIALQLALLGLNIRPGDEIIVPGFSFAAPVNMVLAVGAKPVYADVNPHTWCLEPDSVKRQITSKTKGIIAVHLYGNVCAMEDLKILAKEKELFLIEDTAEAVFSKYKGQFAGTFGHMGCFSFQATKTLTMGEGGCVVTNDKKAFERMQVIRNHGMTPHKRYWHEVLGYNFRLTNIQAAMGFAQLSRWEKIVSAKQRVYQTYVRQLNKEQGIVLQEITRNADPVIWSVAIKLDPKIFKGGRDSVMREFGKAGIETRRGFYSFGSMPFYHGLKLPVSDEVSRNTLSLPSYIGLTQKDIRFICNRLKSLRK